MQGRGTRAYSIASFAMLGIALVLPLVAAGLGTGRYGDAGSLSVGLVIAYAALAVVSWAIFRRKSPATRSHVSFAVALAMFIGTSAVTLRHLGSTQELIDERGRVFVQRMLELSRKQ